MKQKVAVVGVGKLGLCFALNLEKAGFEVLGVETNQAYATQLANKTFESAEPQVNELLREAKKLTITTDVAEVTQQQIKDVFLMVATPSLADGGYDHSQIERVAEKLKNNATQTATVHLYVGCTTMPGYCNQLAKELEPYGYSVSYNPEFIAQGSIIRNQQFPDQVLIGEANKEAGDRLQHIYQQFVKNTPAYCRMDPLSAEIAKLATNCFLTTKISFANSIGDLAQTTGADAEKILEAIGADSRIGPKYLGYGFGFGGPCFPRDNRALGKFAESVNYPLRISQATDQVNQDHFQFQLNQFLKESEATNTVVIEGVAYKKGTTQLTESQQLKLAVALAQAGRVVTIIDSEEVIRQVQERYPGMFKFETVLVS